MSQRQSHRQYDTQWTKTNILVTILTQDGQHNSIWFFFYFFISLAPPFPYLTFGLPNLLKRLIFIAFVKHFIAQWQLGPREKYLLLVSKARTSACLPVIKNKHNDQVSKQWIGLVRIKKNDHKAVKTYCFLKVVLWSIYASVWFLFLPQCEKQWLNTTRLWYRSW